MRDFESASDDWVGAFFRKQSVAASTTTIPPSSSAPAVTRPLSTRSTPGNSPNWPVPTAGPPGTSRRRCRRARTPYPEWLVTELAAVDTELGILKTGKEADVFLIDRGVPDTDRHCVLAAKRYRSVQNRMFHRDAGYLEGRRVRESRDNRAMAKRTIVGMQMIAAQWANAEFGALCQLYSLGVPVPYPVQIIGTEVLEEFIGDHGHAGGGAAAGRSPRRRRTPRPLGPTGGRHVVDGPCRVRARRPVRLQHPGPPRAGWC